MVFSLLNLWIISLAYACACMRVWLVILGQCTFNIFVDIVLITLLFANDCLLCNFERMVVDGQP